MFKFLVITVLLWQQILCQCPDGSPGCPRLVNIDILVQPPIRPDYVLVEGLGAYKLYTVPLDWNQARETCRSDGGHLAIIRSDTELRLIIAMMNQNSVELAWLGLHDLYKEGTWVSLLDESLPQVGWAKWSSAYSPNPDNNSGRQHCASLMVNGSGMDDDYCDNALAFVCKI